MWRISDTCIKAVLANEKIKGFYGYILYPKSNKVKAVISLWTPFIFSRVLPTVGRPAQISGYRFQETYVSLRTLF